MGRFDSANGAAVDSKREKVYFLKGEYLMKVTGFAAGEMRDSKQPWVAVEMRVEKVLSEDAGLRRGQKPASFYKLEQALDRSLTTIGAMNMGRLKAFIVELMGGPEVFLEDNAEEVLEVKAKYFKGTDLEHLMEFDGMTLSEAQDKGLSDSEAFAILVNGDLIEAIIDGEIDLVGTKIYANAKESKKLAKNGKPYVNVYWDAYTED